METIFNKIPIIESTPEYYNFKTLATKRVSAFATAYPKEKSRSTHAYSAYFPFLSSPSTLAGYQFLSPHLAITILPILTEDVEASGLNAR
jgi:hypothetical protein